MQKSQRQTVVVTADDVTTSFLFTMNGKTISVLGSGTGVNPTAAAIVAALAASSISEFAEATWSNPGAPSATIQVDAKTPGVPFVFSKSVSGGTGTLGAITTVTPSSGKWHVDDVTNWSLGVLPATSDTIYFQNCSTDATTGSPPWQPWRRARFMWTPLTLAPSA